MCSLSLLIYVPQKSFFPSLRQWLWAATNLLSVAIDQFAFSRILQKWNHSYSICFCTRALSLSLLQNAFCVFRVGLGSGKIVRQAQRFPIYSLPPHMLCYTHSTVVNIRHQSGTSVTHHYHPMSISLMNHQGLLLVAYILLPETNVQ